MKDSSVNSQSFVQNQQGRVAVPCLTPYLRTSLDLGNLMDAEQMSDEDRKNCHWIGFGFAKGVTDIKSPDAITVLSLYPETVSTLHGLMIQGFSGVDEYPWCYHPDKADDKGFGGFVRWAYFADPREKQDVLAVDFEPGAKTTNGKAVCIEAVAAVARICLSQGIRPDAELILANPRMCEDQEHQQLRESERLLTVKDWAERSVNLAKLHANN